MKAIDSRRTSSTAVETALSSGAQNATTKMANVLFRPLCVPPRVDEEDEGRDTRLLRHA